MEKQVTNNRSADPKTCNYYLRHRLQVYRHRCHRQQGCQGLTVTEIRDEQKLQINISKAWSDSMIVPSTQSIVILRCRMSLHSCHRVRSPTTVLMVRTPRYGRSQSLGDTITSDMLTPDSVNFMGETVSRSPRFTFMQDVCGNVDSVVKKVYVPDRQSVVQILPTTSQSVDMMAMPT